MELTYRNTFSIIFICILTYRECTSYILHTFSHHTYNRNHHHKFHRSKEITAKSEKPENNNDGINNIITTDRDKYILGDRDPCLVHYCPKGRECEINSITKLPECVCQRSCTIDNSPTADIINYNRPICGSDGMVYENHCELHRAACILNRPIAFQRLEKCTTSVQAEKENSSELKEQLNKPTQNDDNENIVAESAYLTDPETDVSKNAIKIPAPIVNDPENNTDMAESLQNRHCTSQEYEIMKDNLLLFSHARLMTQDNNHSKDFLVSIMFSHYDQNNNGHLDSEELNEVSQNEQLDELSNGCVLRDMLQYDDLDQDHCLNINEFYQAFNKLYSKNLLIKKNQSKLDCE